MIAALALPACALDRRGIASSPQGIDAETPGDDAGEPPLDAPSEPLDAPSADACVAAGDEVCNGADDDCDPSTADGAGDPMVGQPCDGIDADECADGVYACVAGALACSDDGTSTNEVCNRLDDDCDGRVDELGPELCNGVDDDCDGFVDEAGALGTRTFHLDFDADGHGDAMHSAIACTAPPGYAELGDDCDDGDARRYPGATETCDGQDEDCSGVRDDAGACAPCGPVERGGTLYQLCPPGETFDAANDFCNARGYHLVSIEDGAENAWLAAAARPAIGRFWIGVRQVGSGWIRVADGAAQTYLPWHAGEPNDGADPSIHEDCVEIGAFADATWNDAVCANRIAWICER